MKSVRELSNLKNEALDEKLKEFNKELMKFHSQISSGTVPKNPGRIKLIKKNIARVHTIKTRRNTQRNE